MALPLRERLESLARERTEHEEQLQGIRRATGEALLEVEDARGHRKIPGGARERPVGIAQAAEILGLSRPTAYLLRRDAEESQ